MKTDENLEISVISAPDETAIDQSDQSVLSDPKKSVVRRCLSCLFRFYYSFLPSKRQINMAFTKFFVLLLFTGTVFGILYKNAFPGSEVFSLLLLALLSFIGGKLFGIIRLPPLVGMLIVGFLYRNLPIIPYHKDISHTTASSIRDIALVIILLSSGIRLDGKKLRKMKLIVVQLTCIPLFVEVASMTVFAHYFLDLPWTWGIMLGFIVSAVSIAVVLPILLKLRKDHLGNDKGIPTLILAASSLDDIVAITGFTITLSIVFIEGNLTLILIRAPLEPLVGCAIGAVFGVLFWHLPSTDTSKALLVYYHILLLIFGGLSVMFVTERIGIPGSGCLSCLTLAFVATLRWRKDVEQFVGIESVMGIVWKIVEPFMFALIGSEVSLENLHSQVGYSVLSIVLALLCRILITPFVTCGANLNLKEKLFVSCAWLPKAVVQAAMGSQALDYARINGNKEQIIKYGEQILTVCVLSIVLTAPLGAALTSCLGPVLLTKDVTMSETSVNEEEISTAVKTPPINYGSCHQLQPSDILPPKDES